MLARHIVCQGPMMAAVLRTAATVAMGHYTIIREKEDE
jgi:hypothetical protein